MSIASDVRDTLTSTSRIVTTPSQVSDAFFSPALIVNDEDRWRDAVDTMLGWYDGQEEIEPACLDSAIDFAVDMGVPGSSAPSSILATEDGEVTFEWRGDGFIMILTIVGSGQAEYTVMRGHRVVDEGLISRDPQTRKLQLGME